MMNSKKKKAKKPLRLSETIVPQFTKEEIKEMASSSGYKVGYVKGYLAALRYAGQGSTIHTRAMQKRAKKLGL